MAFTLTPAITWADGDVITATKLNTTATPTLANNQTYTWAVGAAATPSINFTGATTTGFFYAASYVGVSVAASMVGRFTASGLNSCAIGTDTASTGAFSTISATGIISSSQASGIFRNAADDSLITLAGGTGSAANIKVYGGTHATLAKDIIIDADTLFIRDQAGTLIATFNSSGLTIEALAGSGSRTVVANASGLLSAP